jgi:hypothetical protein
MINVRVGAFVSCLATVVVLSAVASDRAAETTLRWKFAAGQKRGLVLIERQAMKADLPGQKLERTFTRTSDLSWEVKGVDKDGNADLVGTIDRVRLQLTGPGSKVETDTANGEDAAGEAGMMGKLFRAMTGSPFTMKVTPRGKIRDFTVLPKLVEAVKATGPAGAMIANEESLKNLFAESMVEFPEAAMAQGKTWKGSQKYPMPPFGTIVADMTYTLESPTGEIENIGIDAKLVLEPGGDLPGEVKLASPEMKGHYRFDNAAGILKASEVIQKYSLKATFDGHPVTQYNESTVRMELKPGKGAK